MNFLLWAIAGLLAVNMVGTGIILVQQRRIARTERIITVATKDVQDALTALQAEVAQDVSVENSALVFIQGIEAQLANLGQSTTDPATAQAITDLQTALAAQRTSLATAIATPGTPATGEPTT